MNHKTSETIKTLAFVLCYLSIISCSILGIVVIAIYSVGIGITIIIGGVLGSWIYTMILNAFGQLIENTEILLERTEAKGSKAERDAASKTPNVPQKPVQKPQALAFEERIKRNSTFTLEHILQNPKRHVLYSEKELRVIQKELESRKATQAKAPQAGAVKNATDKLKKFAEEIHNTSTDDLELILRDQKRLYSKEEFQIIQKEFESREESGFTKNAP